MKRMYAPEFIASSFHKHYEDLAPLFGYETREDSAVPWEDVPMKNRHLMEKVVTRLIATGVVISGPAWHEHLADSSVLSSGSTERKDPT